MKTVASLGSVGVAAIGLCVGAGCPQLKDDDFGRLSANNGGGATTATAGTSAAGAAFGGSGGAGICTAGRGGCGGGGRAALPAADGGAEPDAEGNRCGPDEATGPNGACYFVDSVESTWSEARRRCQTRGAGWDLATFRAAEENAFVLSVTGFEAWIGATDAPSEGLWSWVGDPSPFFDAAADAGSALFSNWNSGEPNDLDDSDCLRMLTTGLWADWPCGSTKGHVCQRTMP